MTYIKLTLLLFFLTTLSAFSQENCLTAKNLKALDASWEQAQLELDYDFVDGLLGEDFIWVHNHAGTIDDKKDVLNRIKRGLESDQRNTKSRNSRDVKVIILGTTAVVNGFTVVDRGPTPTTYNFMRTYAQSNGKCYLIANHTMAIPDED